MNWQDRIVADPVMNDNQNSRSNLMVTEDDFQRGAKSGADHARHGPTTADRSGASH
jgi:hypothetical protein